jgi:Uma2 family endonuclease
MALGRMVDPKKCRVFTSELKVRVAETGLGTYPDVAVVCGDVARDPEDPNAIVNPRLVVEVLSPGTEAYDRGEKWAHYRRIPTLEAYLLVNQIPPRVEIDERQSNGDFVHRTANLGERLPIATLHAEMEIAALYEGAI